MFIKLIIAFVLLCIIITDSKDTIFQQFLKFKEQHSKSYSNMDEFVTRFNIFKDNFLRLQQTTHTTYKVGITKFSDWTIQEYINKYLNLKTDQVGQNHGEEYLKDLQDGDAPDSFDWRDHGAVSGVKDQKSCGSCWTFSTVGNLEGLHAIKTGQIAQYSEQQIVDCDKNDYGCLGGYMENAFDYIKQAGGIESEQDYPYTGMWNEQCTFDVKKTILQVKDKIIILNMDETQMKELLFKNGPLAIALNAKSLVDYKSGIVDDDADKCNPLHLNHGVTLVGYGSENGKDFWTVKNSWGADWGEKGYFRMARGKGTCGINTHITSAVLA
jgi:cathepsin F